jgi:hypothetical protein
LEGILSSRGFLARSNDQIKVVGRLPDVGCHDLAVLGGMPD